MASDPNNQIGAAAAPNDAGLAQAKAPVPAESKYH